MSHWRRTITRRKDLIITYILFLEQADFFHINWLREWILEKHYVQAVKTVCSIQQSKSTRWRDSDRGTSESSDHKFRDRENRVDEKVEHFIYSTRRKFWSCKEEHCNRWTEEPSYWTKICRQLPQDGNEHLEQDVVNLVEIRTKTKMWFTKSSLKQLKGVVNCHDWWMRIIIGWLITRGFFAPSLLTA